MPRKRCPNGTHRNKKTGQCKKNEISKLNKLTKKRTCPPCTPCPPCPNCSTHLPSPPKHYPKQLTQKRKRCPKGTRKNKKTGLCEPTNSKIQKQQSVLQTSSVIDVPPIENIEDLGRVVHKTVETLQKEKTDLFKTVNTPSFTPNANKRLTTLNMKTPNEVMAYKCIDGPTEDNYYADLSIDDMKDILKHDQHFDSQYLARVSNTLDVKNDSEVLKKLVEISENYPKTNLVRIKIGNGGTEKDYKCVDWKDETVKHMMLDNLNSKKEIDFSKIIGPQQYLSNCWFNTAMMCIFISDKGRKFTRGMREDMINGNIASDITTFGATLKTKKTLFMYNIIIDNALRGILDVSINTNYIIQGLHSVKQLSTHFIQPDKAWNPFSFISKLQLILDQSKNLYFKKHMIENVNEDAISKFKADFINKYVLYRKLSPIPDILIVELYDDKNVDLNIKGKMLGLDWVDSTGTKNKATYTMTFDKTFDTKDGTKIKYKLDSAILRSNAKKHFSAYITGNGKEYRFDGHTKSHLQPFEWKKLLNKNKNFNFKKDETPNHWKGMPFNFSKAYQLLFYYRI
jgi:hypothetical protein